MAVDTSLSFARWQQGEPTVSVVAVVFYYPFAMEATVRCMQCNKTAQVSTQV